MAEPMGDPPLEVEAADYEVATPSTELQPEDGVLVALQKLFPQAALEVLEPAATWLNNNFGIIEYADLEGLRSMADMAMGIVASDVGISENTKLVLRDVLTGRTGTVASTALSLQSLDSAHHAPVATRDAWKSVSRGEPQPDDSMFEALQKLFPQSPLEVLEPVATWLGKNFGVVEYADVEGVMSMADVALGIIAGDSCVSADAKGILREVLGKGVGAEEPSPVACKTAGVGGGCASGKDGGGYPAPNPGCAATATETSNARSGTLSRWDDFVIVGNLGSGSFATVHKVKEKTSQRRFALKEISSRVLSDEACREQIQREMSIHKKLDHPHVLHCYESFEKLGSLFLLLELAEGGDLYQYMKKDRLPEGEAAQLFTEVVAGVHYLHAKGWMHRDLKPENIVLAPTEEGTQCAKVADFGECAEVSTPAIKECGSPAYMSPEMCAGQSYDRRVDIWALGILLYEMLMGSWPFALAVTVLDTKSKILNMQFAYGAWSNVPAAAQSLLKVLIQKGPDDRLPLLEVLAHPWLVSYVGTSPHLAAEELEEELHEEALAIDSLKQQMEDLKDSTDASALRAVLEKGMQFETWYLEDVGVQRLRARYDGVRKQMKRRLDLIKCAYHNNKNDIKKLLASLREEKLDAPDNWLLPDGPKLFARAELMMLELDMGQRGGHYAAMDFAMDIEAPTREEDASVEQEELDLVRIYRDWQVTGIRSMLQVPVLRFVASDDLSERMLQQCEKLCKEVPAHRKLQLCAADQDVESIQRTLNELREDGLDVLEGWILPSGSRLLTAALRRLDELRRLEAEDAQRMAELEAKALQLASSIDVLAMQEAIAELEAFGLHGERLEAIRERSRSLQIQHPLCLELRQCSSLEGAEAAKRAIARAQEANLEAPTTWLLNEGPSAFAAATRHVASVDANKTRIDAAVQYFDAEELCAAFEEADSLNVPPSRYADARKLFLSLQDPAFVEAKMAELRNGEKSELSDAQMSNLLKLAQVPDDFGVSSGAIADRTQLNKVLETAAIRDAGFPVQLTITGFLHTFAVLISSEERAKLFRSAGSKSGTAATAETDIGVAAQILLESLAKLVVDETVKASDAIIAKTSVFMRSRLHASLEGILRQTLEVPAVRIQSAWRGAHARAVLRVPLLEAVALNRMLREKTASVDCELRTQVASAAVVEEASTEMDELVRQAMRSQLPLPRLSTYAEARKKLVAQARLARQIEDRLACPSAPRIDALIARAAACRMEGPLIDRLAKQSEELQTQLHLRRRLLACAASTSLEEIEEALDQTRAMGLDVPEKWFLPDGFVSCSAASSRLDQLQLEQQNKAEAIARVDQQTHDVAESLDARELQALLRRGDLLGRAGNVIDRLRERYKALQLQSGYVSELRTCISFNSSLPIAAICDRVTQAGLDSPEKWLLPDGPKLLARARRWMSRLDGEKQAAAGARADIEQQIAVLSCSLEPLAMEPIIERAERVGVDQQRVGELRARCDTLHLQGPLCESLRRCDADAVRAVQEIGLTVAPRGWLLPDGPRLLARAIAWQAWMEDIRPLRELQDMGLDTEEQANVARALDGCLSSSCPEEVSRVVAEAKRYGLELARSWKHRSALPGGLSLVAAAQSRLEQLEEQREVVRYSAADIEWQIRVFRASLCPSARLVLGEQLATAICERFMALRRQLPHRKELLCSLSEGLKALQKALADVKARDLETPDPWLLPEGPVLIDAVRHRIEQLLAPPLRRWDAEKKGGLDGTRAVEAAAMAGMPIMKLNETSCSKERQESTIPIAVAKEEAESLTEGEGGRKSTKQGSRRVCFG